MAGGVVGSYGGGVMDRCLCPFPACPAHLIPTDWPCAPPTRISPASLPHPHTAALLTTSYATLRSLEKVKKKDFFEKPGRPLHESWAGCRAPSKDSGGNPSSAFSSKKWACTPPPGEKNSALGPPPTLRSAQVPSKRMPSFVRRLLVSRLPTSFGGHCRVEGGRGEGAADQIP